MFGEREFDSILCEAINDGGKATRMSQRIGGRRLVATDSGIEHEELITATVLRTSS